MKKNVLKKALEKGVEKGVLVREKNSYKMSADAKKEKREKAKAGPMPRRLPLPRKRPLLPRSRLLLLKARPRSPSKGRRRSRVPPVVLLLLLPPPLLPLHLPSPRLLLPRLLPPPFQPPHRRGRMVKNTCLRTHGIEAHGTSR